ncbi:MAG: RIP metalloprotease RseP [Rikenellaceae bacterium]|nr:RIP metalloprotease RseP [Rikenellaceae bacterium]
MEVLIKIGQFVLSFSLLVIIHEFGHFIFARMFGIRVEKFYLFFNPGFSLFKKKIGDTEYGIGWVPFGGYVKIAGMIDESMDTEQMKQPPQPYEFRSKPAWQRLLVMLGGVIMNVVLALLIFIGMSWKYGEQYIANEDLVYGWAFNELGHEIGFENGDRILAVDGKPIERAGMVFQELLLGSGREVTVLRDGRETTVTVCDEFVPRLLNSPDLMDYRMPFVVGHVAEGSGAERAGIIPGDSLVAADSIPLAYFDQYLAYVGERGGRTVDITLYRTDARSGSRAVMTLPVELSEEGKMGLVPYYITRYVPVQTYKYTLLSSIPAGFRMTGRQINGYIKQLKLIFSPKTEAYKSLRGPLGIYDIFPKAWDWSVFWTLTGFLSIVLAVMNILPIPGLDGGHTVFVLYEMATGRKPGEKFMEYAQLAGLLLLFAIIIYATGNDILRLFTK